MLLTLKGRKFIYEQCPVFVVDQINLIPDLSKRADVHSFYMPYLCYDCQTEFEELSNPAAVKDANFFPNIDKMFKCPTCETFLKFYDEQDLFFDFILGD